MSISLDLFTCPHCLKENATLFDTAKFKRPLSGGDSFVFSCRTCDKSLIIDLELNYSGNTWISSGASFNIEIINQDAFVDTKYIGSVINVYPKPKLTTIPEYLSEQVSKNIREAKELLNIGYFNQSAITSRRAIDLATKELLPEHTGMLNSRLKQLFEKNIITEQLHSWADIIRLDGNSATHDHDDFTKEQAEELIDFTEMFLMYAFTLPLMVELKRPKIINDD